MRPDRPQPCSCGSKKAKTLPQPSMACSGRYIGRVVVEEAVPGAVVAVELVGLAVLLQLRFVGIDLSAVGD